MKNKKINKFTDNNWFIAGEKWYAQGRIAIESGTKTICYLADTREETIPNGNLICAARSLLSALKIAKQMINDVEGHKFPTAGLIAINEAIAKAEGK